MARCAALMSPEPTPARAIRPCAACGQHDDHPRGIHVAEDGVTEVLRHYDCCTRDCPLCGPMAALADGRTGQDLIDHLDAVRDA